MRSEKLTTRQKTLSLTLQQWLVISLLGQTALALSARATSRHQSTDALGLSLNSAGTNRNKRRKDRRTPGARSYKDIYHDRQMFQSRNKKNKRQKARQSMPVFGGFMPMPMPMMPMMMPMDEGKYKVRARTRWAM